MRPIRISVTGVGNGDVIPIDQYLNPTTIALGVTVDGTITYTVRYTYDDVFDPNFTPAGAEWFDVTGLAAQSANADAALTAPPSAVQLITSAGTGTATLNLLQAGLID